VARAPAPGGASLLDLFLEDFEDMIDTERLGQVRRFGGNAGKGAGAAMAAGGSAGSPKGEQAASAEGMEQLHAVFCTLWVAVILYFIARKCWDKQALLPPRGAKGEGTQAAEEEDTNSMAAPEVQPTVSEKEAS
jgi:preprotein translocase subunit SecG